MPRVQDAIPSLDCRAWKGHSNPLLLSTLRFAPESRPARPQVQGLYLRPETPRHRDHQTRTPPPLRGRTGHWPRQVRAPHGPKLPRRDPRRRRQRRPRRRRLQLQTPARMAGPFVVLDPRRVHRRGQSGDTAQIPMTAFFTGDWIASFGLRLWVVGSWADRALFD